MKQKKQSPALGPKGRFTLEERALRPQAGVPLGALRRFTLEEPLLKGRSYTSPERALRPQAGVKPLLKGRSYTNPERVTEVMGCVLSPLRGLSGVVAVIRGSISFHPCLYSCQAFGLMGGKLIKNII